MAKCVCSVFVFKVTEPSPLRDSPACAKRAAYPDPSPVSRCEAMSLVLSQ